MAADAAEVEKKLRNLRKKLQQIEKLKEKGGDIDDEARKKVATEPAIVAEIAALEASLKEAAPLPAAPAAPQPPSSVQEATAPAKADTKPKAKAAAAAEAAKPAAAPAAATKAEASSKAADGLNPEQEKQIRNIKKKLTQIAKLKEKGGQLDAEAQEKVNSEARLLRELTALENGEELLPEEEKPQKKPEKAGKAEAALATVEPAEPVREDPHAEARAIALETPPGDLGLLLDDETEKKFKSLQKKLRDIGKLHEKDKLDKLQVEKLAAEPGLIEELNAIREKAAAKVEERRNNAEAAKKAAAERKASMRKQPASGGAPEDLEGYGYEYHARGKPGTAQDADEDDDDDEEEKAASVKKKFESQDLKTAHKKKAAAGQASGKRDLSNVLASPSSAKWPEVKEALQSGEGGVDKSRQKKAVCVDHSAPEPPYTEFDQVLLKCSFLTRIELKLPPGVLASEAFQLYFPGALSDGLLELIIKENALAAVPAGIKDLTRVRSIDISHNKITTLPGEDTWEAIAGTLELLDLSFNQLESIQELAPCTKLSSLKVDANKLTTLDGISWSKLKQLSMLTGVANQLAEIPEAIEERAESLEIIDLSENKITAVPTAFKELKKLKSLSLAGNPIKDQKAVKAAEKGIKDLKAYLSKVPKGGKK